MISPNVTTLAMIRSFWEPNAKANGLNELENRREPAQAVRRDSEPGKCHCPEVAARPRAPRHSSTSLPSMPLASRTSPCQGRWGLDGRAGGSPKRAPALAIGVGVGPFRLPCRTRIRERRALPAGRGPSRSRLGAGGAQGSVQSLGQRGSRPWVRMTVPCPRLSGPGGRRNRNAGRALQSPTARDAMGAFQVAPRLWGTVPEKSNRPRPTCSQCVKSGRFHSSSDL